MTGRPALLDNGNFGAEFTAWRNVFYNGRGFTFKIALGLDGVGAADREAVDLLALPAWL